MKSSTTSALLLAMLLFFCLEGVARLILVEPTLGWDYWSQTAASKYITYFRLKQRQNTPNIMIVGDSSADYGFSPLDFKSASGLPYEVYNLATLGNFALAYDETVNHLMFSGEGPHPKYLMIIFTRGGFTYQDELRQTEQSILQSPVMRRMHGEVTIGHLLVLSRFWRSRSQLLAQLRGAESAVSSERGFIARNDNSGEPIKKPENRRVFQLDLKRLAVLENTFKICQEKGIQPILVHPPIHAYEQLQWINPEIYRVEAKKLADRFQVPFWDYSHDTQYDPFMRDYVHLNYEGAVLFSKDLAKKFQATYAN